VCQARKRLLQSFDESMALGPAAQFAQSPQQEFCDCFTQTSTIDSKAFTRADLVASLLLVLNRIWTAAPRLSR
jgi:hypothetical protein